MALLRTILILFWMQTRALARSKRGLICLLLALGPAAAALFVRYVAEAHGDPVPAFEVGWMLIVQSTVPLVSLILGSAVVAEEIEDRTITFLFTRPVPRAGVLLGRLLAAVAASTLLLTLGAELTFAVLQAGADGGELALPPGMAGAMRDACVLGALVYTTLFAVAGALFKHPMIIGIGYTFVIEGFVAFLPGQNASVTVQYHLKSWVAGQSAAYGERMRDLTEHQELAPSGEALQTLLTVLLVATVLGVWNVSRKQYLLPS